jgi:CheY-like chemotaxis protein
VQAERLLAAGAQLYLTKPIDVRQFLQVLDDILETGPQVLPPAQQTMLAPETIRHGTESYSA